MSKLTDLIWLNIFKGRGCYVILTVLLGSGVATLLLVLCHSAKVDNLNFKKAPALCAHFN